MYMKNKKLDARMKLSSVDVMHIKTLKDKYVGVDIAKQYSVSPGAIYAIWKGRTWKQCL